MNISLSVLISLTSKNENLLSIARLRFGRFTDNPLYTFTQADINAIQTDILLNEVNIKDLPAPPMSFLELFIYPLKFADYQAMRRAQFAEAGKIAHELQSDFNNLCDILELKPNLIKG